MNYKGDIDAKSAFDILKNEQNSFLVDVRTMPEWSFSGLPDLSLISKEVVRISWLLYPRFDVNQNFLEQLSNFIPDQNTKIFFLCKVGGRSTDAAIAATNMGYKNSYNILNGFEGDLDKNHQRGKVNGWKASGLPWFQA